MADPSVRLHLPERAATVYLRGGTGARLHVDELRDLRAQIDAAIAGIDHAHGAGPAPTEAAIERSLAKVLDLIDERRKSAPAWRAQQYARINAHSRSACPEAELAATATSTGGG